MSGPPLSVARGTTYGAAFGVVAGLVMAGIGYVLPVPMMKDNPPFFINAVEMWMVPSFVVVGWVSHLITSAVIGAIFGFVTARFATFGIKTVPRMVVWGVFAGLAVWFVVFLPVEIPPMPGLFSMGDFLATSLGYNVVFGLVLSALLGVFARRKTG